MSDKLNFLSDMNQKLQSLLTLLKTFSHPVAISELSEKLNKSEENISDRTIRRYLQQLSSWS